MKNLTVNIKAYEPTDDIPFIGKYCYGHCPIDDVWYFGMLTKTADTSELVLVVSEPKMDSHELRIIYKDEIINCDMYTENIGITIA